MPFKSGEKELRTHSNVLISPFILLKFIHNLFPLIAF